MRVGSFFPRAATLAAAAASVVVAASSFAAGDLVAVRAGTVHTVAGEVIEGGATVLTRDGKIVAVGRTSDVVVPPGARTVDYGEFAVVVPGFVAADSRYGSQLASGRTADPGVRAVDNFDPYTTLYGAVTGGVTTLYMAPARGRLIAGQGAVVKSAGEGAGRIVKESGILHGSISRGAPDPGLLGAPAARDRRRRPRRRASAAAAHDDGRRDGAR